ncbi:MAG TPA: hypothetical protein VFN42_09895 [Acetobacteraceae bacterium]|nr:hypothetical protein [Acetobacteraceae bacterium]
MSHEPCRSDCLSLAAHWRQRAADTGHSELGDAYRRIAESYERLAKQALLCRRLVTAAAERRGEAVPCQCGIDGAIAGLG